MKTQKYTIKYLGTTPRKFFYPAHTGFSPYVVLPGAVIREYFFVSETDFRFANVSGKFLKSEIEILRTPADDAKEIAEMKKQISQQKSSENYYQDLIGRIV